MTPIDHVVWDAPDDPNGNVLHIARHGITIDEYEEALENAIGQTRSRRSGRPLRFGYTNGGRFLGLVFEWCGRRTAYPITAFDAPEPGS